jgi:hypothetical protein
VVFALPEDDEYDGMAHVWVRDAETAYWFSLSRRLDSDAIKVMVSDQLTYAGDVLAVTLSASELRTRLTASAATMLDGHVEYVVEFHPESDDIEAIAETLSVIFRGKPGLQLALATSGTSHRVDSP